MRIVASTACALILVCLLGAVSPAQNCANTSVGLTPLNDLGTGTYMSEVGGLYAGGANTRPAAHEAAGLAFAAALQPLDAAGMPSASGKIALVSIGMSNTSSEYTEFVNTSNADPNRNPDVVVVNGAQGGQHAAIISNPAAMFWTVVDQRLAGAGLTPAQVQAVWIKQAVAGPSGSFLSHATSLQTHLGDIVRIIRARYPNCALAYLSSRIYAGYAVSALNPEPFAYESGFSVKWLIEDQIGGDPMLNADPAAGAVMAPWLAWGPYLWADGLTPRSDGLVWPCTDFAADGTHPGPGARTKVANMLHQFFSTDTTTSSWYLGSGTGPTPAGLFPYGFGCTGTNGIPHILTNSLPQLGNANFHVGIQSALGNAVSILLVSLAPSAIPVDGCTVFVDPNQIILPSATDNTTVVTNANGNFPINLPIPGNPIITGVNIFAQWFVYDPLGVGFLVIGGGAMTQGLQIRIGV